MEKIKNKEFPLIKIIPDSKWKIADYIDVLEEDRSELITEFIEATRKIEKLEKENKFLIKLCCKLIEKQKNNTTKNKK